MYAYIENGGGGGGEGLNQLERRYLQQISLANSAVARQTAGPSELINTDTVWLNVCCLTSDELWFVNIYLLKIFHVMFCRPIILKVKIKIIL